MNVLKQVENWLRMQLDEWDCRELCGASFFIQLRRSSLECSITRSCWLAIT